MKVTVKAEGGKRENVSLRLGRMRDLKPGDYFCVVSNGCKLKAIGLDGKVSGIVNIVTGKSRPYNDIERYNLCYLLIN